MDAIRVIKDIITREGGYSDHAADKGGATKFGITAQTLGRWRSLGRPATPDEVKGLKEPEAELIYFAYYVVAPGFDQVRDDELAAQLVDFGVNSGPMLAIQKLQSIIGVEVDGMLGPKTLEALALRDPRLVNNQLVAERVKMIGRIVVRAKNQIVFLGGWLDRALSFLR